MLPHHVNKLFTMTVLITIAAGIDTGPFDLYSDVDGFVTPFETNVSKPALEAGYTTSLVPNGTTIIRVQSLGVCPTNVDITLVLNSFLFDLSSGTDCPDACFGGAHRIFF